MSTTLAAVAGPPADSLAARTLRVRSAVPLVVLAWAIAQGTYSQYTALVNQYVVNGDAPSAISWMQRFRDPRLFSDDLLTNVAAQMHGQPGFVLFYRAFAPFADPLVVSKLLPIVLLAVFALYTWRFVLRFGTAFAALLTAGIAIVAPTYMEIISGGHQRAFALPMLMAFLYYTASGAWRRACVVLGLQALFYPMAFLLCVPTYALAWLDARCRPRGRAPGRSSIVWFVVIVGACGTLLAVKNVYAPDPQIGRIVTRADMEGRPEFYASGRTAVLPVAGLHRELAQQMVGLVRSVTVGYPGTLVRLGPESNRVLLLGLLGAGLLACVLLAARAVLHREVAIPPVLFFFLASGAALYVLADLLLFRLYLPNRYLIYTVQTSGLLIAGICIGYVTGLVPRARVRLGVQVALLALVACRVDLTRNIGLSDQAADKPLFEFLGTLPPEALIASHPAAADYIPTFARRKVFVNFELSYPFYDAYWQTITARTRSLFDAYYAESRADVYEFCSRNGIDYLVVRERDFDRSHPANHRIYFDPFDAYARGRLLSARRHALATIRPDEMLFRQGDTFVIHKDILTTRVGAYAESSLLPHPPLASRSAVK